MRQRAQVNFWKITRAKANQWKHRLYLLPFIESKQAKNQYKIIPKSKITKKAILNNRKRNSRGWKLEANLHQRLHRGKTQCKFTRISWRKLYMRGKRSWRKMEFWTILLSWSWVMRRMRAFSLRIKKKTKRKLGDSNSKSNNFSRSFPWSRKNWTASKTTETFFLHFQWVNAFNTFHTIVY